MKYKAQFITAIILSAIIGIAYLTNRTHIEAINIVKVDSHYNLVINGTANVNIIIPANASDKIKKAGQDLQLYISKISGDKPLLGTTENEDLISIHIGNTPFVMQQNISMTNIDAHGYTIQFPDSKNIVIVGGSDLGTLHGTYAFCETFLGISWLFPSELGEYIPEEKNISIIPKEINSNPKYLMRLLSGIQYMKKNSDMITPDNTVEWAHRLGGQIRYSDNKRVEFHHNLCNLFDPDKFGNIKEIYPVFNKKTKFVGMNDKNYLEDLTKADLEKCDTLLKSVIAAAQSDIQKERARFIYKGFKDWSDVRIIQNRFIKIDQLIDELRSNNKISSGELCVLEAEKDFSQNSMIIAEDKTASGGKYIYSDSEDVLTPGTPGPFIEYEFSITQPGKYILFLRNKADNPSTDSFFIVMDNKPDVIWDVPNSELWKWTKVDIRFSNGKTKFFDLAAGKHTLKIKQREKGAMLDKLIIIHYDSLKEFF